MEEIDFVPNTDNHHDAEMHHCIFDKVNEVIKFTEQGLV